MSALSDLGGSSAFADLGPVLPARTCLRAAAREAHQLVLILLHETAPGGDLVRAARTMEKLRAVVGSPAEKGDMT